MKSFKIFLYLLICFFSVSLSSCDTVFFRTREGTQGEQGDKGLQGLPGDGGSEGGIAIEASDPFSCISITGERFEKYMLVPFDPGKTVDLSDSASGSYYINSPVSRYTNATSRLNINGFPIEDLAESTEAPVNITGTLPLYIYYGVTYPEIGNLHGYSEGNLLVWDIYFNQTVNLTPEPLDLDGSENEYSVATSFKASSLSLPKTSDYSSKLNLFRDINFSFSVSKQLLESIVPKPAVKDSDLPEYGVENPYHNLDGSWGGYYTAKVDLYFTGWLGCDLHPSITTEVRHRLESRNFYQYKSLKVTYPANAVLAYFNPGSLVKSFDYNTKENSLTINFKDYNSVYIGDVFSFTIAATVDGNVQTKDIKIKIDK